MRTIAAADRLPAILRHAIVGLVRHDEADLSARQLVVLLICVLEDGPHTLRSLAERLNVGRPAIIRAVDRLEQLKLARRAPNPRDLRSVLITYTARGAVYVQHVRNLMMAAARRYSTDFPPRSEGRSTST